MPGEVQVTSDHQTGPVYDPRLQGNPNEAFLLVNQSATVDIYLDRDTPMLLNQTSPSQTPVSGTKLSKNGGQILWPSGKEVFARCDGAVASRTTMQIL